MNASTSEPICPCCGGSVSPLDLLMDDKTLSLAYAGKTVKLTGQHFRFVKALVEAYPRVVSKEAMMDALYPTVDDTPEIKIIDVFACKIRRVLDPIGLVIVTAWGVGYAIEMNEEGKAAVLRNRRYSETRKVRRSLDPSDIVVIKIYRAQGYPITDIARRLGLTFRAVVSAIDAIEADTAGNGLIRSAAA